MGPNEAYMRKLVKAADKLSALIKCIGEMNAGNSEHGLPHCFWV